MSVALVAGTLAAQAPATASPTPPTAAVVGDQAPAVVTEREDAMTAQMAARAQGTRVEVTGARSATARLWAEPDGSFTQEAYNGPNWTLDAQGEWVEIDTRLVQGSDGVIRPKAAAVDVSLAGARGAESTETKVATVAVPKDSLAAIAEARTDDAKPLPVADKAGDDAVSFSVGFDGALPTPELIDNEARYREVQPGRDLRIAVLPGGIETFVDLTARPEKIPAEGLEVTLPIDLQGLAVKEDGKGGLLITDPATGKVVGTSGAAHIWDATAHPVTGDSENGIVVASDLRKTASGWDVVVTVPAAYFDTKGLTYPITVDPPTTLTVTADTFVQSGSDTAGSNFGTYGHMNVGTYDGGTHAARAYLAFHLTDKAGLYTPDTIVESAKLKVWEYDANSCTASDMFIRRLTSSFNESTVTWNSKPTQTSPVYTVSDARIAGQGGACTESWIDTIYGTDVRSIVQGWADGTSTNYGFALTASETSSTGWKRFYSNDTSTTAKRPSLVVNFHHRPITPPKVFTAGRNTAGWIRDATPTLQFTPNDGDAGSVTGHFAISTSSTFTTTTWSTTTSVTSGTLAMATPSAALSQGTQYYARVRASQASPVSPYPTEYSTGYSANLAFKVDTVAPTVTVSCTGLPADTVTDPAPPSNVSCSASATDGTSNVAGFPRITLDGDTAGVTVTGSGTSRTITVDHNLLTDGKHQLIVEAIDNAGNSKVKTYEVGIGKPFLSLPADAQATSDGSVEVQATASTGSGVQFQYSTDKSTWTTIPASDLETTTGGSVTTPVALVTQGGWKVTDAVRWKMSTTLANDTTVFVRPCVVPNGGGTCVASSSEPTVITLDRSGAGAAQTSVGPVSVALTTGAASLGSSDASVGSVGVGRSYNSFSPATAGPFGLGWTTSLSAGSGWTQLVDDGAAVRVYAGAGDPTGFTKNGTSTACPSGKYDPPADATDLTVCKISATSFTLTEGTFQTTTFTQQGTSTAFLVTSVEELQTGQLAVFDADSNGVVRIVAPLPSGLTASGDCPVGSPSTWAKSCADLQISYSSGRVSRITWRGWEQPLSGASAIARSYDVACYRYDGSGHLTQVWDPRDNLSGYAACGTGSAPTGALVTGYGYDGNGRLNSITPGALRPWEITYDGTGRATTVFRTHGSGYNSGATETTTIQYGVTIGAASSSSDDTHPDLTAAAVENWWPADPAEYPVVAPVTATAVFPPGASTATLKEAAITAMDDLGTAVMTASFSGTGQAGWRISTQVLDPDTGMRVASLSPGNRAAALDPASEARVLLNQHGTSAEAAQLLSTQTVTTNLVDDSGDNLVNGDDVPDVTDTYGPLHMIDVGGDLVAARTHVHTTYGSVKPGTTPATGDLETNSFWHTPLTVTEAGWDPSTKADITSTVETTKYAYAYTAGGVQHASGWDFSTPVQTTTVVPGGTDIVKRVVLDATTGAVLQQRQPSAADDDVTYVLGVPQASNPGTYITSTWKDGAYNAATCTSSVWYGLPCVAKPASGTVPAASQTYYDVFDRAVKKVDTGASSTTRTSEATYGNSGLSSRIATNTISGGASGDKAVPDKAYAYSSTTGLPTGVTSGTGGGAVTATTSFDDFGRPLSSDDGYQGVVTVTYENTTGRPATITRTQNGASVGTSTYSYNGGTEKRGLPTSVAQSMLGTLSASYDADGAPITQITPMATGTLTASWTRNTVGQATELEWTRSGVSDPWLTSTNSFDAHGRVATDRSNLFATGGRELDYNYDKAGRLTAVNDTRGAQCLSRTYAFDITGYYNSNRANLKTYDPTTAGACQTTSASSTTTYTYSSDDQPTGTGLIYDVFGRTSSLPSAMTVTPTSSPVTIGYHVNDLVASTLVTPAGGAAQRQEWTLDSSDRLACRRDRPNATTDSTTCGSTVTNGVTDTTNHYVGGGDSPSWTETRAGSATPASTTAWYVPGLSGGLLATVVGGSVTIGLSNLHGDIPITATTTQSTAPDGSTVDTDEYGVVRDGEGLATTGPRYAWLGTAQRDASAANGLTLMGVRLYNPLTGRFLSTDPVWGGNANTYGYPVDPINRQDINGKYGYSLNYNLGYYPSQSLHTFFWRMVQRFGSLFPLAHAGAVLPGVGGIVSLEDPLPWHDSPVRVTFRGCGNLFCAFSFISIYPHLEGPGKRISFTFRKVGGSFMMNIVAYGPDETWQTAPGVGFFNYSVIREVWQDFAHNLHWKCLARLCGAIFV